jgi:hypothetical protein
MKRKTALVNWMKSGVPETVMEIFAVLNFVIFCNVILYCNDNLLKVKEY